MAALIGGRNPRPIEIIHVQVFLSYVATLGYSRRAKAGSP